MLVFSVSGIVASEDGEGAGSGQKKTSVTISSPFEAEIYVDHEAIMKL